MNMYNCLRSNELSIIASFDKNQWCSISLSLYCCVNIKCSGMLYPYVHPPLYISWFSLTLLLLLLLFVCVCLCLCLYLNGSMFIQFDHSLLIVPHHHPSHFLGLFVTLLFKQHSVHSFMEFLLYSNSQSFRMCDKNPI